MGVNWTDLKYLSPAYDIDRALGGSGNPIKDATNAVGLTNPDPADISKSPDAEKLRQFAGQLSSEYATNVAKGQSDQSRGVQQSNIDDLAGVASGKTKTAADTLLMQGTDTAARAALGTAATYSAQNPGDALRQGLAAGSGAYDRAAATAAMQKAQEQSDARAQLAAAAGAMRGGDITETNNLRKDAETSLIAPMNTTLANQKIQADNNAANSTALGGLASDYGKGLGASDETLKTNIRDGSPDADAFLSSLTPRSYEWKDQNEPRAQNPGGPKLGVLAQELRPDDTVTAPDGKKWISADVIGKVLAGMGRLHERVGAIEGKGPARG